LVAASSNEQLFSQVAALVLRVRGHSAIHCRNVNRETPLHSACKVENFGHGEVAALLLSVGAHIDAPDARGITPLGI